MNNGCIARLRSLLEGFEGPARCVVRGISEIHIFQKDTR